MQPRLIVSLLPELLPQDEMQGATAVVIDVLRASTTITAALAAGAREIIPCAEVEEARMAAQQRADSLSGGERQGLRIPGFDLGNSPTEYGWDRVSGKSIAFTTTNGTRAMQRCKTAQRVLIGAFVNLSAICDQLREAGLVVLLCAGTNGEVTREDVLFAGAVVELLDDRSSAAWRLNDQAEIARAAWRDCRGRFASGEPLASCLRDSHGGRNLVEIGRERDIEIAAAIDRHEVVAELFVNEWVIRVP